MNCFLMVHKDHDLDKKPIDQAEVLRALDKVDVIVNWRKESHLILIASPERGEVL